MTDFIVTMETLWDGSWKQLGRQVTVSAGSPEEVLSLVAVDGLKDGVTYRLHLCTADRGDVWTEPALSPDPSLTLAAGTA